jgi:hypothetical protein
VRGEDIHRWTESNFFFYNVLVLEIQSSMKAFYFDLYLFDCESEPSQSSIHV